MTPEQAQDATGVVLGSFHVSCVSATVYLILEHRIHL
jgi:hypothetical protein